MNQFWMLTACAAVGLVSTAIAGCHSSDEEPSTPTSEAVVTPLPAASPTDPRKDRGTIEVADPRDSAKAPAPNALPGDASADAAADADAPPPAGDEDDVFGGFPDFPEAQDPGEDPPAGDDGSPGCSTSISCVNGSCTCGSGPNVGKSCDGAGAGDNSCAVTCRVCE